MADNDAEVHDAPPRTRPGEWMAVSAIVALAALLRCVDLQWMEFKGDEAVAIQIALDMLDQGKIALTGLVSSVGVSNPPVFVYWIALIATLTRDPIAMTALAVAVPGTLTVFLTWLVLRRRTTIWVRLSSALTMACAPWAVLYSRKIWAQDLLPVLCVTLLGTLLRVSERSRSRSVFWVPILVALLWQIHFSATGLAIVAGALLLWRIRDLHWAYLFAGTAVAIATLSPYLTHLHQTDFADLDRMLNRSGDGAAIRSNIDVISLSAAAGRHIASISADTNLDYALGNSAKHFSARTESSPLATLRFWGGKLGVACLAIGLILLIARRMRRAPPQRGAKQAGADENPRETAGRPSGAEVNRTLETVLLVWMLAFGCYLWLGNVEKIYPHYFVVLYPVPFILLSTPIGALAGRSASGRAAAAALLGILVLAQIGTLIAFRGYVHEAGGTAGDYGVAYRFKKELTDWAVREGATIVAPPNEYAFLMRNHPMAVESGSGKGMRVVVLDHLRGGSKIPRQCASARRFGPISACILN